MIPKYDFIQDIPNVVYGIIQETVSNGKGPITKLTVSIPHLFSHTKHKRRPSNTIFLNAERPIVNPIEVENVITLPLANKINTYHEEYYRKVDNLMTVSKTDDVVVIQPFVKYEKGQRVMIMKTDLDDITQGSIIRVI